MRRALADSLRSLIAGIVLMSVGTRAAPAQGSPRPSLIVLLTIDQGRADYLDRWASQLTGGLGRLARGGARFTDAHHDHAITETAPGHATLLSGRFPRSTGIMANRAGVEDEASPLIAGGVGAGASPKRFTGTTLTDWLVAADPRSRTLSVSTKDRGAILPAGKRKSDVYWYSLDGRFTTSAYYRPDLPSWVTAWNDRHYPQTFAGKVWDLLLPASAYDEPDSVVAEGGQGFLFPHGLPEDPAQTANVVRGTPFIDDITLSFALHGVQATGVGSGASTDLLAISLSGTDYIGHRFGSESREMHDQIVRLDRALGVFLDSLFRLRDPARVTIALSADHGAGAMPELTPANAQPRPVRGATLETVMPAIRAGLRKLQVDTLAIETDQQVVFADRAAFERARVNMDSFLDGVAKQIRGLPGVARADRFTALTRAPASDAIARRWTHQFPERTAVALVVTLTPYSLWGGSIASHGSPYDYDSHVPLVFYGAGVRPGSYDGFVRTVDLAPTLAAIAGVTPTEPLDGVVLRRALP